MNRFFSPTNQIEDTDILVVSFTLTTQPKPLYIMRLCALFLVSFCLLEYETELQVGRTLTECSVAVDYTKRDEQSCRIDLDSLIGSSPCTKENDFGYEDGMPCVLLKMNRVGDFACLPDVERCCQASNAALLESVILIITVLIIIICFLRLLN